MCLTELIKTILPKFTVKYKTVLLGGYDDERQHVEHPQCFVCLCIVIHTVSTDVLYVIVCCRVESRVGVDMSDAYTAFILSE